MDFKYCETPKPRSPDDPKTETKVSYSAIRRDAPAAARARAPQRGACTCTCARPHSYRCVNPRARHADF